MAIHMRSMMAGRQEELETLLSTLSSVISGKGQLIFISGEAGIGKTRLMEELESRAAVAGCVILVGKCIPGTPAPLLPFREAFGRYFDTAGRSQSSGGPSGLDPQSGSICEMDLNLFDVLGFLRNKSSATPLVIRIEDVHWADSASIQMLHFLARNLSSLRVLFLCTYRPEDLVGSEGEVHPLTDALRNMGREGILKEIHLARLKEEDVTTIVNGFLAFKVEREVSRAVAHESEGNPLFALEVMELLVSTGQISKDGLIWRMSRPEPVNLPTTIRDVIMRRLDRLSRDKRKLIEYAAVIGNQFDADLLAIAIGKDRIRLLEDLESLERETRLIQSHEDGFQFSHELIRRVAHDEISKPRKKEMHRMVGEAIEARGPDETKLGQLAMHFYVAGEKGKCSHYSLMAGEICIKKSAAREAIPYLAMCLEIEKAKGEVTEARLRTTEGLGIANELLNKDDTAMTIFEEFLSISGGGSSRPRVLRRLAEIWSPTRLGRGDSATCMRYLDEAEECTVVDLDDQAHIAGCRATIAVLESRFEMANALYCKAEDAFEEAGDAEQLILHLAYHSSVFLGQGRTPEAIKLVKRAFEVLAMTPCPLGEEEASYYLGLCYFCIGESKEALAAFKRCVDIAQQLGDHGALCFATINRALIYDSLGDVDAALREAELGHEVALRTESELLMIATKALLVHEEVRRGEVDAAERYCQEAFALAKEFKWGFRSITRGLLGIAQGEVSLSKCQHERGFALIEKGMSYIKGAPEGLILEAMAHAWYGDCLTNQGMLDKAGVEYREAARVYKVLGNEPQIGRLPIQLHASSDAS